MKRKCLSKGVLVVTVNEFDAKKYARFSLLHLVNRIQSKKKEHTHQKLEKKGGGKGGGGRDERKN